MISKKSLESFKKIYKEIFAEELDNAVALKKATDLLNLYQAVFGYPDATGPPNDS